MHSLQKDVFLDVNSNTGVSGKELVSNLKAINNSIFNILGTPVGSRTFRPDYGSKLAQFLHEPLDDVTATQIKTFVVAALSQWEPRIVVDFHSSFVTPIPNAAGFVVLVAYSVPSLSVSSNTSITFAGE